MSLAYASALIAALTFFAALAVAVVDGSQRAALNEQLQSTANALRIVGDVRSGRLLVDKGDREQFRTIVAAKAQSAIFGAGSNLLVSTDDGAARSLLAKIGPAAGSGTSREETLGADRVRVFTLAVSADGARIGTILVWDDVATIEASDRRVTLAFAFAIPLIAALAVAAGGLIARRGLAPLEHIVGLASEIEARDLSRRLRLPAQEGELGRLGATFDRMLDRLQGAFERERRFTSDASHELRAPLSVIRAEADLALRCERSPAEYRHALVTIASEADALETLTRDLLAAARGGANVARIETIDLGDVADAVAARLTPVAGTRRLRVVCDPRRGVNVHADRALLERAVMSALHNALKYASEDGLITVAVASDATACEIVVSDDGPGFSAAALERAFERFWRDDDARAREGSGLGLSIARAIVERFGGSISLANAVPHGAIVRMAFPPAVAETGEMRFPSTFDDGDATQVSRKPA